MNDKPTFIAYKSWRQVFKSLPAEQSKDLICAVFDYQVTGEIETDDPAVIAIFNMFKETMDADSMKYEETIRKRKEAGASGGRPPGKTILKSMTGKIVPDSYEEGKHYLYLLFDNKNNQFKIGETKNLKKRRYEIRRPTADLDVVDFIIGTNNECQKYEEEILQEYQQYSVGGDWFDFDWNIAEDILSKWFGEKPNGLFSFNNKPNAVQKNPVSESDSVSVSVYDNDSVNDTVSVSPNGEVLSVSTDVDTSSAKSTARVPYREVVDLFHKCCPTFPDVSRLSEKRKRLIKGILKDFSMDEVETVFRKAEADDFYSGRNGRWTNCNFDWLMTPSNFLKILEKKERVHGGTSQIPGHDELNEYYSMIAEWVDENEDGDDDG